ncbi:hypothetical protein QQZ08_010856 [Neonectria magnoliae]|uniref:EKC/KEOPS complex subunit BUD32 n=1 Tax=Neonectria magnoliae TaxID=2732573 RepID=A0ABR1HE38_9HYPO
MCTRHMSLDIYLCGNRVETEYKFDACNNQTASDHTVRTNQLGSTKRNTYCNLWTCAPCRARNAAKFLGAQGMSLLLGEANHGDLQDYLIAHPDIPVAQRLAWCRQITEAIEFIHGHGVIHSDLRPGNILIHESAPGGSLDLQLCDFGGAVCEELGVDGQSLPDGPFYSPVFKNKMNTLSDIFSLGSVMYTIITGRWPYRDTAERFENIDDRLAWEEDFVYPRFQREEFPDVDGLALGKVILGCWKREFGTVQDVLRAIDEALPEGEQASM